MFLINLLGVVLYYSLLAFVIVMWGRLILDFVRAFAPQWRPPGIVMGISGLIFTITDPPIRLVRRWVKPVQIGSFSLDFAWAIVILAATFAMNLSRYLVFL